MLVSQAVMLPFARIEAVVGRAFAIGTAEAIGLRRWLRRLTRAAGHPRLTPR
jgi:hypothetical protein